MQKAICRAPRTFVIFACLLGLSSAPASAEWALAFGKSAPNHWSFGSSWNKDSTKAARQTALERCDLHGPNCKIILEGAGACVALAVGITDNVSHASIGPTRLSAAQTALTACAANSVGDCEIRHSFCENE